jgi:hypothetical protein
VKKLLAVSCLLWCALALAAPRVPNAAVKAVPDKASVQSVKTPPSPNGRKGGEQHQAQVKEVAQDVEARGLQPKIEHMVETPEGSKSKRFVDVVGIDKKTAEVKEMHQVGRQTKKGQPVAREREAMDDIQKAEGKRPEFHPYNK